MKKIIYLLMAGLFLAFSCEKVESDLPADEDKQNQDSISGVLKADTSVLSVTNRFGLEIFNEINNLDDFTEENVFISPVSLAVALSMAYNGASGETREAFEELLHFEALAPGKINKIYQAFIAQLENAGPEVFLGIANSIWYRDSYHVEDSFLRVNNTYYDAEIRGMDFNQGSTVDSINNWVAAETNDKIKEVIKDISPETMMYIINAIYFNAEWAEAFDEEKTYPVTFHGIKGDKPIDMMQRTDTLPYFENDLFQCVELAYGDGLYSMVVMLPREGKSPGDILAILDQDNWVEWTGKLDGQEKETVLHLPKFTFRFETFLKEVLMDMGLGVAFSPSEADFSYINPDDRLFISDVLHKSFIDVHEKGTEAAAVTVIVFENTSMGPDSKKYFIADRPFLFFIREKTTNTALFAGKAVNLEKE